MTTITRPQSPSLEARVADVERWAREVDPDFEERVLRLREREADLAPPPAAPQPTASAAPPAPERRIAAAPVDVPAPRRDFDIERFLGGQVLAWVGGVAVLAGLVLLFALGVSHGWIGPLGRTLVGAVVAALLTGFGVRLHERHGRTEAARAAVGAGVAGLFLTVTVASRVYDLIPPSAGLLLAGAIAAGSSWLALRWTSRTVGAIGIIGALAAPMLTGAPAGPASFGFLLVAGLGATFVLLRERWGWLAGAVLVIPALEWVPWLLDGQPVIQIVSVLVAFAIVNAAAAVGVDVRTRAEGLDPVAGFLLTANALLMGLAGWLALRGTVGPAAHELAGVAWLAGLAGAHALIGTAGFRRHRISTELHLTALVLATLLANCAFGLADIGGPAKAAGWALAAVGFALVARRAHPPVQTTLLGCGIGGQVALSLFAALAQLDAADVLSPGASQATVAALLALASGCLISGRITRGARPQWQRLLDLIGLSAAALLAMVVFDGWMLTAVWASAAVALGQIGARTGDADARWAAYAHLLAACLWCVADQAPPAGLIDGSVALAPAAAGLGLVALAALRLARLAPPGTPERKVLWGLAALAPLYFGSLAVVGLVPASSGPDGFGFTGRQQGQLGLSALWAVAGVAALVAGLRRDVADLRRGALALLALTIAKVFLYDLATLTSVWRISSFLALGLLLLGAAFAYQRLRPRTPGVVVG
jgi:uncharacterized membrane protein